ncbi:hypothetical protein CDAR_7031 [Caerostris darwini]|uniref:Uncharacterized protein n=1 Tax=Caerostris darwini TaxID=1538125 RepID=A0AAV4PG45_9ARAC|nr:hypothetical protein CDAR_7031 [Caerostris darwini]
MLAKSRANSSSTEGLSGPHESHDSLTVDDVVLQQQTHGDEGEVEEEHDERQSDVHLPLEASDGDDDEQQHQEQDDDGAGHASAAHFHRTEYECRQEPGCGQSETEKINVMTLIVKQYHQCTRDWKIMNTPDIPNKEFE